MFLHLSVSHSVHRGVCQTAPWADTPQTPPRQTPPSADTPLSSACWNTPPAQCMLGYTPPLPNACWDTPRRPLCTVQHKGCTAMEQLFAFARVGVVENCASQNATPALNLLARWGIFLARCAWLLKLHVFDVLNWLDRNSKWKFKLIIVNYCQFITCDWIPFYLP